MGSRFEVRLKNILKNERIEEPEAGGKTISMLKTETQEKKR
jgi:hypothetical protein